MSLTEPSLVSGTMAGPFCRIFSSVSRLSNSTRRFRKIVVAAILLFFAVGILSAGVFAAGMLKAESSDNAPDAIEKNRVAESVATEPNSTEKVGRPSIVATLARVAESPPAVENTAGNIPMKWIPNQKVLLGAPPTVIELGDAVDRFAKEGAFGPPEDFSLEKLEVVIVAASKSSVVKPTIDGTHVVLNWTGTGVGKAEVVLRLRTLETPPVFLSFFAEAWTPNWWWMLAIVLGGLGIFLFGMKNMSEGVQLLAGKSLRRMIAIFTENRILAFMVGILTTMLLQSSSVTTVMVIGFINSQIMTLSQGIGVILGANIGTTITGWILSMNIGAYGLPIAGISAFFSLFSKNENIRYFAEAAMGLGLVFFGLQLMSDGFSFLRELPEFSAWMKMFAAHSFFGALKCALVGCVLTMVVQSSSATIGITMSLAIIGAIEFPTAAALVLGENIGTTITAVLVSIGASTNARRAAAFHVMFNMIGVFWVLLIFIPIFLPFVTWVAGVEGMRNITVGIAAAHTIFNVTNALLFLPFARYFADLLVWLIPEQAVAKEKSLTSLSMRRSEAPAFAIERSRAEVERMATRCLEMGGWLEILVEKDFDDERLVQQSFEREEILDKTQDEIIDFTSEMLSMNLSHDVVESAREQLRMADELETISDYFIAILKSDLKLKNDGLVLPPPLREGFNRLHTETMQQFETIVKTYNARKRPRGFVDSILAESRRLTAGLKKLRGEFLHTMSEERFDPQVIAAVNSQLNYYRRLWEHQINITEAFCRVK